MTNINVCVLLLAIIMRAQAFGRGRMTAVATFNGTKGIEGTITFTQKYSQQYLGSTIIAVDLTGLTQGPNPWHVHVLPSDGSGPSSTGPHFDPLGARAGYIMPPPVVGYCPYPSINPSPNACEVGDLSARLLGNFTSSSVKKKYKVNFLTLFGHNSIVGRSLVIHNSTGARLVASNIMAKEKHSLIATATFAHSGSGSVPLKGAVSFFQSGKQPKIYDFNKNADVSVLTDLEYTDERMSTNGWGICVHPTSAGDTTCSSCGVIFNANGGPPCTQDSTLWHLCQDGDMSGKHGKIYIPGAGSPPEKRRNFTTDPIITLAPGGRSIIGMSLVILNATDPSIRIACSTIVAA